MDEKMDPRSMPSAMDRFKSQTPTSPTISAVTKTPTVESRMPFTKIDRIVVKSVSKPPEKRIKHSAAMPTPLAI